MTFIAILLAAVVSAQEPSSSATPKTKAEIEQIVREYLQKHPEAVIDAIRTYQANQQIAEKLKAQEGVVSHRTQLFSDPAAPVSGPEQAPGKPVTIVEFFDYHCGYCKKVAPTLDKLITSSQVRVIYKEFPILGPDSTVASKAALAARKQGKYLGMHNDLLAHQGSFTMEAIEGLAAKHGIDVARLKADMESPEIKAILDANQSLADAIGVNATPSFVIGNELITGALDDDGFKAALSKGGSK